MQPAGPLDAIAPGSDEAAGNDTPDLRGRRGRCLRRDETACRQGCQP
jgi:hypothetical protein